MNTIVLVCMFSVAGLAVGAAIAAVAPRLVAYRLEAPPNPPPLALAVPLLGPWLARTAPLRPLLLQLLTAGAFGGLALHYGGGARLALAALYTGLLAAIAYIDVDHRLVLNRLTYPGLLVALVASALWPGFSTYFHPLNSLLGALVGLAIFAMLQLLGRGAMGTGDTKLAMLIGAMVGLPAVLSALLLGVILGGLGGLFFLLVMRRGRKTYMAYAPYLCVGAILYFLTSA